MKLFNKKYIITLTTIALLAVGCSKKREYFSSNISPADIKIFRFDSALLSLPYDSASIQNSLPALYDDFPYLMPVFAEDIIGVDKSDTAWLSGALSHFLTDTLYGFAETNKREQEIFADTKNIKKTLDLGFGRLRSLYPDIILPDLYFIVSGFNASLFFLGDDIVLGADMYLGSDYPYYNKVVYNYQKKTMRPECIPADVLSVILFKNIPFTSDKSRLIDNMLYRGKIIYLLLNLLKEEKVWEVMGYTKEEWQWCERNERAIWRLMLDKQDLYKTETIILTSYLNDGPFTSEISQESPSKLGTWVGLRIIEQYMLNNKEVTLSELMAEGNSQKILELSQYKP